MSNESNIRKTEHEKYPLALAAGTVLACRDGEKILCRYEILKVLGQGGFGVTYLARDCMTGQEVAVKEYLPMEFATRAEGSTQLTCFSEEKAGYFEYGRKQFLEEAKTLSQFAGNANVVRIYRYFETNNTAYFVMEFAKGSSLEDIVKKSGPMAPDRAAPVFRKLMTALADVHSHGIVHRDIAPDNIIICANDEPKLIDFGAARYSTGEKSCSLDVILKHGFAPFEQYRRHGRQGPFTDVYALAATYYYAVTGRILPDSIDRLDDDSLIPPTTLGVKLPPQTENALLKALNVQPQERYANMTEFQAGMFGNSVHVSGSAAQSISFSTSGQTDSVSRSGNGQNVSASSGVSPMVTIAPLLQRVFLFLEGGKWDRADEYCEKILDMDPQNGQAYLGKLMAELRARTSEELKKQSNPLECSENYGMILRFADPALKKTMEEINESIKKRGAYAEAEHAAAEKKAKKKFLPILLLVLICLGAGVYFVLQPGSGNKTGDANPVFVPTAVPTPEPTSTPAAEAAAASTLNGQKINVGEYVTFGSYEQDNDTSNGAENIEWLVLDKKDGRALLLSRYGLEARAYNEKWTDVTWENCTLRTWLNNDFLNAAFSSAEQKKIETTAVSADKNPNYSTNPGNATMDKIFLLSIAEAEKYFMDDASRMCAPTKYAKAQGAYADSNNKVGDEDACWWWLRSPGTDQDYASDVSYGGSFRYYGFHVRNTGDCVRPALWVNLTF